MKKLLVLCCTALLLLVESDAQFNFYILRLKNKGGSTHTFSNPSTYLSQRAIDRRARYNIAIDSTDLPVSSAYISQISSIPNVQIYNVSRWLNTVAVQISDPAAITAINALPFVHSIAGVANRVSATIGRTKPIWQEEIFPLDEPAARIQQVQENYYNYGTGASYNEIHLHNGEFLHNLGLRGQGMQLAMMDGGFYSYNVLSAFDSANEANQFLSTWDFVDKQTNVADDHPHGMSCLSTIAANMPGLFIGTAPKTKFHLFRTENVASEYPIEEFNWACAAERADSVGADVISSSLGYGYGFNNPFADYPYSDLNGNITMAARAADLAAKKGVLVFNAAGNSGNDYWKKITTPADGDSVVAVGGVNILGVVGSYSSYGPSGDGQVKPDLAAVGTGALIQTPGNTVAVGNGTSYACPKLAGLATCLWQGFPEFNNMKIVQAMKEAGSIYTTPDDRIGYGIPDMKKAFVSLLDEYANASLALNSCEATLTWTSKDIAGMKYEIERKGPGESVYTKIGIVDAQDGGTLTNHTYEFINSIDSLPAGNFSYRIRQIVDTSTAGFTSIYINAPDEATTVPCIQGEKISFAPNPPVQSIASLKIETIYAISNLLINIYNMDGRLMMRVPGSKPAGRSFVSVPVGKLGKGKYIVKVYAGNTLVGTTTLLKM